MFRWRLACIAFATFLASGQEPPATAKPGPGVAELPTPYDPPPGDPVHFHAAGLVQVECAAVFVTGFPPGFAAENIGFFVSPLAERAKLSAPLVDRERKQVSVTLPDGVVRRAQYVGDQGCVTLPAGDDAPKFKPAQVRKRVLDPKAPWPDGDAVLPDLEGTLKHDDLKAAIDSAFDGDEGSTAAVVVTWKGRLVGERYAKGVGTSTPLESWSMGKSLTATLIGVLIKEGVYDLWQRAPIPEWQEPEDRRADIRIADLLRMSSGLRIRSPFDPGYVASTYPDHLYYYTGAINSFKYAASRPQQWPPNTVGRYRNTDPVLANYLVQLAARRLREDYLAFPQRHLLDKLGITTMVLEVDAYGNFLTNGYELASARDWARLANLYLQDGIWKGERLLPEGFVDFVRTPAPAWVAEGRPIYGGFFWLNRNRTLDIPEDAYYMSGVGGQHTVIIPSHHLVVVRMGHDRGQRAGVAAFRRAIKRIVEAVPPRG